MRKKVFLCWMVFLLSIPFAAFSQTRIVTGKVTDETGKAVPLATIEQKGQKMLLPQMKMVISVFLLPEKTLLLRFPQSTMIHKKLRLVTDLIMK